MKQIIIGLIPARMESSRFWGKPLVEINGIPMVVRVFQQTQKCEKLSEVYICTDSIEIKNMAEKWGCNVLFTTNRPLNGTERCEEAYRLLGKKIDGIVNIQGDEPFINPNQIDQICGLLENENVEIVTLGMTINNTQQIENPNIVKIFVDSDNFAQGFARQIEHNYENNYKVLIHIGIYGYKPKVLQQIVNLKPTKNEILHNLEQLRWMDNGFSIKIGFTNLESIAIDTPADLLKLKSFY